VKKLIIGIVFILLSGCDHFDSEKCLETVQAKYPSAVEISLVPGKDFEFLVNTGDQIRLVRIMGSYNKITSDTLYMRVNQQHAGQDKH
jgi:hypothetical protein